MAKRRGNQEGSIYQRKDGRWAAQISFIGADGKRKVVPKYFRTQAAARRELTKMKSKQDAHRLVVGGKGKVRAWLDVWLESFIKPNRAPRTYVGYHDLLEHHLPDRLGHLPLTKLAPEDLQRQFNAIAAGGHPRTAELLRAVLRSSFNKAVKLGRMETNPVLGTDPAKYAQRETATFTAGEGKRFLDAAEGDRLGALFIIALSLGLRKGEVIGLKPEDIDLDSRVLYVRRSLAWVKLPGKDGRWIEREPKRGSFRDLPITETIYRALVRHLARRQEEAAATKGWRDSGYLFTSVTGAPFCMSETSARCSTRSATVRRCPASGSTTPATVAVRCSTSRAPTRSSSKVLGHSQLSTTKQYTHVPIQVTKAALDGLESLFKTAKPAGEQEPAPPTSPVKPS